MFIKIFASTLRGRYRKDQVKMTGNFESSPRLFYKGSAETTNYLIPITKDLNCLTVTFSFHCCLQSNVVEDGTITDWVEWRRFVSIFVKLWSLIASIWYGGLRFTGLLLHSFLNVSLLSQGHPNQILMGRKYLFSSWLLSTDPCQNFVSSSNL